MAWSPAPVAHHKMLRPGDWTTQSHDKTKNRISPLKQAARFFRARLEEDAHRVRVVLGGRNRESVLFSSTQPESMVGRGPAACSSPVSDGQGPARSIGNWAVTKVVGHS
jgi:hypothetical protein